MGCLNWLGRLLERTESMHGKYFPIGVIGIFLVPLLGVLQAEYRQAIVINEFMASNGSTLQDEQHQYDDWIELYNPTDVAVDVGGMYLTDDRSRPMKWQVPSHVPDETTLNPRGFLLLWADNEINGSGLHAGFGLRAAGEEIALYDVDGQIRVDLIAFPEQSRDVSYGRYPDGQTAWCFMSEASPGSVNEQTHEGIVDTVRFSQVRGFYHDPITVTLTTPTPGATIYYSLDGTSPIQVATRGQTYVGMPYSGPLTIDRTTCVTAVATKAHWKASPMVTSTYVYVEDVLRQSLPGKGWPSSNVNGQMMNYGMDPEVVNDPRYVDLMQESLKAVASIALTTDIKHLFDPAEGIYVNARSALGRAWERPVSVELIYPDGQEGFQINAGLRIRGGFSRIPSNPKHAFRLFFRSEYGAAQLEYPLFGDDGVAVFDNMDLRTSQNYSWAYQGDRRNTMVREVFSRDVQRDMGHPHTRSRYYHLYLNGQYWGLYQTQERSEASYAATYLGGRQEDYDVIKTTGGNPGYTIEATDGSMDAWRRVWEMAPRPALRRMNATSGCRGSMWTARAILSTRNSLILRI